MFRHHGASRGAGRVTVSKGVALLERWVEGGWRFVQHSATLTSDAGSVRKVAASVMIEAMHFPSRRRFLAALAGAPGLPAVAQFRRAEGATPPVDAQGDASFRVDVNVVNVLATVRDKSGAIVKTLDREDFLLQDDGGERDIVYFARQTDTPLTIGILFDTSQSQRSVLEAQREAAYRFLDRVLRPEQDQAFVIRFDADVELVQDLTASRELLREAIRSLRTPDLGPRRRRQAAPEPNPFQVRVGVPGTRRRVPGRRTPVPPPGGRAPQPPPTGTGDRVPAGAGTMLYDAVYLSAREVLEEQDGRKAILLISDGNDYTSKVSRNDAVEASQRADAQICSVLYYEESRVSGGRIRMRGVNTLRHLSSHTGGSMYEVSEKTPIDAVFQQIEEELRNQYSLGFHPPTGATPGFRPLEVRVRDKTLRVQARQGYYWKPD